MKNTGSQFSLIAFLLFAGVGCSSRPAVTQPHTTYYDADDTNTRGFLDVDYDADKTFFVRGFSSWRNTPDASLHTAIVRGSVTRDASNKLIYEDKDLGGADPCRLEIEEKPRALSVVDVHTNCGGANVSFSGTYHETTKKPRPELDTAE